MNDSVFIDNFEQLSETEKELFQHLFFAEKQTDEQDDGVKKHLVAYVSSSSLTEQQIRDQLLKKLPNHMVPNHIMVLNHLPKLPNGKVNLSELRQYTLKTTNEAASLRKSDPTTEKLKQIWQDVLQIDSIGIHDNFFEYGGDSILAIQIVSKARNAGIELAPSVFLEKQTIAEILSAINEGRTVYKELQGSELVPIQSWFFDTHGQNAHWHLGIQIHLESEVVPFIKEGLNYLLQKHTVLNTAFVHSASGITMRHNSSPQFAYHELACETVERSPDAINDAFSQLHEQMSLQDGRLSAALLVHGKSPQLFLSFHHLVVDPLSLLMIFDDLSDTISDLKDKNVPVSKTHQSIHYYQLAAAIQTIDYSGELNFWRQQCQQFRPLLPGRNRIAHHFDTKTIYYRCGSEISVAILQAKKKVDWIQNDVLFASALVQAVALWANRDTVVVGIESSLRKLKNVDAQQTVGWMTSYYPLSLQANESAARTYFNVDSKFEQVKNSGCGYGVLRYHFKEDALAIEPEVLINYIGKMYGPSNSVLGKATFIKDGLRSDKSIYSYILEFNITQENNDFTIACTHLPDIVNHAAVTGILDNAILFLQQIINDNAKSLIHIRHLQEIEKIGMDDSDLETILSQL